MLEKIGLPAKPSMRGSNWVVDASHCQGCSSQFTFINRKHHCRRCGGLFCNSCTQQRIVLRGQGDSPVRICDPCKKLEDAARFELRYGHKSRAAKGNSKQPQKPEEVLGQILGADGKLPMLSVPESHSDLISDLLVTAKNASSSNLKGDSATPSREGDITSSSSVDMYNNALIDTGSSSPEELRQQAVEEKKKYRILKGEGKAEEALQAFKRGKELERQAGALEIALRKNRRMASRASNLNSVTDTRKIDDLEESSGTKKLPSRRGKEEKDDFASELRELGWSGADLHDEEKKPVKLSLEGELSNLLREIPQKSSLSQKTGGIGKTQVVALKRKALSLKREGKLAEAKEELKRAKVLEKQLEEQELLGEADDSDDELTALIHSMDDGNQDDLLLGHEYDAGISFDHFIGVGDDLAIDGNFEVTADDLNDPGLAATLRSFGWTEEDDEQAADHVLQPVALDREALQGEVLTLKREALSQKRAGNVAEAMALLKKAKLLEKDLETMLSDTQTTSPEFVPKVSAQISGESSMSQRANEENFMRLPPRSRISIQKELLALKKKALALRREGQLDEADEELRKGKVLEQQLEEMETAAKRPVTKVAKKNSEATRTREGDPGILDPGEEGVEADVTEQDMHDPALMSVLKNLGWNDDDDVESESISTRKANDSVPSVIPRRSKAEIQRELLAVKRKALALRKQGKTKEAEEELEKAKDLEKQMAEMESSSSASFIEVKSQGLGPLIPQLKPEKQEKIDDTLSANINRTPKDEGNSKNSDDTASPPSTSSLSVPDGVGFERLEKPGLKAEGSIKSASTLPQSGQPLDIVDFLSGGDSNISQLSTEDSEKREISHANIFPPNASIQLGVQVTAKENYSENENLSFGASSYSLAHKQEAAHGVDAYKDEILARKRKAVALKREGKLAEAREELRQAKLLEKSLEGGDQKAHLGSKGTQPYTFDDITAMQESGASQQARKPLSGRDRFKLQQESLAHKRNALKLRREGKIDESEAEFELAKALERQLEESSTPGSSSSGPVSKMGGVDDAGVEDLLDPQLMSALKAIGWEETDIATQPPKKSELKPSVAKGGNPQADKIHLEEQIKAEKLRALHLKRAGKQAEALEALRLAKGLEKKLGLLN